MSTPSIDQIRAAHVARALSIVGWTAPDPRYLALCAPWEVLHDPRRAAEIVTLSDCALVAHGLLDELLALPTRGPYVTGRAVSDLVAVAKTAGAIRSATHRPAPGDLLWLLGSPSGVEHVATVIAVDVEAYGVLPVTSVDGGQRDGAHRETVEQVERSITYDGAGATDERVLLSGFHEVRPVGGILDLEALVAWYGLRPNEA